MATRAVRRRLALLAAGLLLFLAWAPTAHSFHTDFEYLVDRFEVTGAARSQPNPGSNEIIQFIQAKNLPVGIITRNSLMAVEKALENFTQIDIDSFDIVISRSTDGSWIFHRIM